MESVGRFLQVLHQILSDPALDTMMGIIASIILAKKVPTLETRASKKNRLRLKHSKAVAMRTALETRASKKITHIELNFNSNLRMVLR